MNIFLIGEALLRSIRIALILYPVGGSVIVLVSLAINEHNTPQVF
jgi:hypothetical protein